MAGALLVLSTGMSAPVNAPDGPEPDPSGLLASAAARFGVASRPASNFGHNVRLPRPVHLSALGVRHRWIIVPYLCSSTAHKRHIYGALAAASSYRHPVVGRDLLHGR